MADNDSTDTSSLTSPTELQPFTYQVGGHEGMQVIGEGSLIVKTVVPLELQFYQNILASPSLAALRRWVPTYLGNLRLEGKNTAEGIASIEGISENEKDECYYSL
jgi:1D-myo-inositol-tetrakisphosphate 5-kinase/inositol-polyphosphate multikinase